MAEYTEEWLREYTARTGCKAHEYGKSTTAAVGTDAPKRNKYGNEKAESDGIRFDSRHEAEVYRRLCLELKSGSYIGLARQVVFMLPGGVKYIADFVTYKSDGSYQVWDAKSCATARNAVYRIKKRQMRECLGIEIQEI